MDPGIRCGGIKFQRDQRSNNGGCITGHLKREVRPRVKGEKEDGKNFLINSRWPLEQKKNKIRKRTGGGRWWAHVKKRSEKDEKVHVEKIAGCGPASLGR